MPLEVTLLAHTPDAARIVAAAARICYSASRAADVAASLDGPKIREMIGRLRASGHMSVFEHASYTFAVDGLSRVASHQLVRHRIASFSQQSQRYVAMRRSEPVIPPSVAADEQASSLWRKAAEAAARAYEAMSELGVPREDARFILPHGWETSLIMTMNARELGHFFALRCCRRAQWEIQELAASMLRLVREATPELFETAGPSCVTEGRCREERPCGRPFSSMDELLSVKGI